MLTMNSILSILPEPILSKHYKEGNQPSSNAQARGDRQRYPLELKLKALADLDNKSDARGSRKRIADKHKITPAALCMFVKQRRDGTI